MIREIIDRRNQELAASVDRRNNLRTRTALEIPEIPRPISPSQLAQRYRDRKENMPKTNAKPLFVLKITYSNYNRIYLQGVRESSTSLRIIYEGTKLTAREEYTATTAGPSEDLLKLLQHLQADADDDRVRKVTLIEFDTDGEKTTRDIQMHMFLRKHLRLQAQRLNTPATTT